MNEILNIISKMMEQIFGGAGYEIVINIVSMIIILLAGLGVNLLSETMSPSLRRFLGLKARKTPKSYKEQLSQLTENLVKSSADVDRILQEINEVSQERETAINGLEKKLDILVEREKHLQQKIKTLESIPIEAADYFAQIVEKGEKRSAWRDYILFGLGVLVSTIIAIILNIAGF